MKSRVKYCDALRMFAILCIVLIHVFPVFREQYLNVNHKYYFILTFLDSLTRTGVPIFFMITGAFMLNKKNKYSYKNFLSKRLLKLFIPFLILSLFYYLYDCFINKSIKFSLILFIKLFTTNGIRYHFWFMYVILLIYLFIPYLRIFVQNLKRENLKNIIILIFIFGNVLGTINLLCSKYDFSIFSSFILPNILRYLNYLFLGYYLYNYEVKVNKRKIIYALGIISICLIPVADSIFIDNVRNDIMLEAQSMFAFIPSIAVFVLFKYNYDKLKITRKINKFISDSAPLIFYIYMIHVFVLECIENIIFKYYYPNRFIMVIVMICIIFLFTVIISYVLAYVLYKLFNFVYSKVTKN